MPTKTTNQATQDAPAESTSPATERTEPQTIGPSEGGNSILSAWQGLYNLMGARVERFDVTPEGIVAVGLTFDASRLATVDVTPDRVIRDLFHRGDKTVNRRLDLIELYPFITGESPEPFTNPKDMTGWMVQNYKGADGDGSRSPEYVKKLIASYKSNNGIEAPRGRKRKIMRLDALGAIRPEVLAEANPDELRRLQETVAAALQISQDRPQAAAAQ